MARLALCLAFITMLSYTQSRSILERQNSFAASQREFSISLLKSIYKHHPEQTHIFSPHSIFHVLTLAHLATGENMEKSMAQAMHLQWAKDKNEVYSAYTAENEQRQSRNYQSAEFNSVDRIFVSEETIVE